MGLVGLKVLRRIDRIPVTEADLREQIRTLCDLYHWKMYFTWRSIHSPAGFPDLVLVSTAQRRVIFAELKRDGGKLTEHQEEWLVALEAAGQEVYIWHPGDIENIARLLRI